MLRTPTLDWYFDVISPFAYLQFQRLREVEARAQVRRVPVLFARLLEHWGQKGPAEIVPKRRFTFRYAVWRAARMGVRLQLPAAHPFNPLKLLRLAVALDASPDAVRAIFDFVWADGHVPDEADAWCQLCTTLGVADGDAPVAKPEVKEALRANVEEAVRRQVFGVPSFVTADGEIFWGEDATDMVLDYLSGSPVLHTGEILRADDLPVGAMRKAVVR